MVVNENLLFAIFSCEGPLAIRSSCRCSIAPFPGTRPHDTFSKIVGNYGYYKTRERTKQILGGLFPPVYILIAFKELAG